LPPPTATLLEDELLTDELLAAIEELLTAIELLERGTELDVADDEEPMQLSVKL
jgi:hypothetical protein